MDILDRFIDNAGESLREGYYSGRGRYKGGGVSLLGRLGQDRFALICEIKHASPAGEYSFARIDVEKAAADFRVSGADAISVVVEPKIFRGDIDNIPLAKKAGLPVLFKDFVISEEQIIAAGESGADAVLLVVKVAKRLSLDLDGLIDSAHKNGLEVLLESYDADELKAAMETEADILGINNRNLQTLDVDIGRTGRIVKEVGGADRPLISESGIRSSGDVRAVREAGADGALVGTAIWKAKDLKAKIRELKEGGADG
ncbi:MAG: indole-3-glycerol-phosphate synthase [Candidatus Micrarchaeota archaeon]